MAVTDGRTLLDNANATTNWSPFGGVTLNTDTETKIFGSGSVSTTADNTGGGEGIAFNNGADRDWTDEIVYMWVNIANPGLMETKDEGGIRVRAANNAGITNFVEMNFEGSDTYSGGWKMFVIDMNELFGSPNATGGSKPVITACQYIGVVTNLITGAMPKMQDNLFIDASWRLAKGTPGIRVENGTFDWADVVLAGDRFDTTKAWGHVQETDGIITLYSSIEFGDSAGATATTFLDATGANVVFGQGSNFLPDDIYAITCVGNATLTTDIDFGAVVGTGDDRQGIGGTNWSTGGPGYTFDAETDISDLDTVNLYGGSFTGAWTISLTSDTKTDAIGVAFVNCGEVQPNNAEFLNNSIIEPSDLGVEMLTTHEMKNMTYVAGTDTATCTVDQLADTSSAPANPYGSLATMASQSQETVMVMLVGYEHSGSNILGVSTGMGTGPGQQRSVFRKVGEVNFSTTITIEAWAGYAPRGLSNDLTQIWFDTAPANLSRVFCRFTDGGRFEELEVFSNTTTTGTASSINMPNLSDDDCVVDMVYTDVSGPGTTFVATAGDATETLDAAIGSEAAYAVSESEPGTGIDRTHDWTWTGSANAAQLAIVCKSKNSEHHVHHPTASDYSITYDNQQFFGFGAAGSPKWHGENSGLNADVTVAASNGSNPDQDEYENTDSGTVVVTNAVTVRVEGLSEGAAVKVQANEQVGTMRVDDIVMEGLADSTGAFQITDFNYEGAFDPSGLDVIVRTRQAGIATGALASDNGVFTDWTPQTNSAIIGWGAEFDGANDWLTRGADLTGIADGQEGTLSFWVYRNFTGTTQRIFASDITSERVYCEFTAGDAIRMFAENTAGTTILDVTSNTTLPNTNVWQHVLIAWDLSVPIHYIYIDDVDQSDATPATLTNDTIDYTTNTNDWAIGANSGGTTKLTATLAEFYFDDNFIDPTSAKNRGEFVRPNLTPTHLGDDGSQPTGTAPLVYLGNDNKFDEWESNKGSGGDFSVTGALTEGIEDGKNVTDFKVMPALPVIAQDSFYIGHAEQFGGVKIDITVAATGSPTITPEYWDGDSWESLTVLVDDTDDLTTLGYNRITWTIPGDWGTSTEDGIGPIHWMRLMFSAGTMSGLPFFRRLALDVTRYIPYVASRTITSDGLTVVATWVEDNIATF